MKISGGSTSSTPTGWPTSFWTNYGAAGNASAVQALGNNTYNLVCFSLPAALTLNKLLVWITTADAAGLYDIGIYNAAGTLVAHTGPIHLPSTGLQTLAVLGAPISLPPGKYYFATTGNAATAALQLFNGGNLGYTNATGLGSATGGTLPATITPPADTFVQGGSITFALSA